MSVILFSTIRSRIEIHKLELNLNKYKIFGLRKRNAKWVWWFTPLIPILRRQSQAISVNSKPTWYTGMYKFQKRQRQSHPVSEKGVGDRQPKKKKCENNHSNTNTVINLNPLPRLAYNSTHSLCSLCSLLCHPDSRPRNPPLLDSFIVSQALSSRLHPRTGLSISFLHCS